MKKEKFLTCMNDKVFKHMIKTEVGEKVFKEIIYLLLGIKVDDITLSSEELDTQNKSLKGKRVDLLINNEKVIINFEINNGSECQINKSIAYFHSLYLSRILVNKDYKIDKKIYQINLSKKPFEKVLCNVMGMYTKNGIEVIKNAKMIEIDMEKLKKKCYDGLSEREVRLYKILSMIAANEEELEEICKGDEIMEKFKEEIKNYNRINHLWFTPEEEEEIDRKIELNEAQEKGMRKGKREGKIEGKKEGIRETLIANAKKMLEEDFDINIINKITGLDKDTIMNL